MFYERFRRMCAEQGLPLCTVCERAGLNRSTWVAWSKGKAPSSKSAAKLAAYFGVNTNYILYGIESGNSLGGLNQKLRVLWEGVSRMSPAQVDTLTEAMHEIMQGSQSP